MTESGKAAMEHGNANLSVINFTRVAENSNASLDGFGHSYFRNAPSVSSDLIIMLRDDLDPGDPGRPLKYLGAKFWEVPTGYPASRSEP